MHNMYLVRPVLLYLNMHVLKVFYEQTRKCGNYSDVLPLKAARRDSISNSTSFEASNVSCR